MKYINIIILALLFASYQKETIAQEPFFAKGGDIGWLSEMEHKGIKFKHASGKEDDCINVLKGVGMNTIRLRVWVNHKDGWCNEADVVAQAVRG